LVDCIRNDSTDENDDPFRDGDFVPNGDFLLANGPIATQEGSTTFTDAAADPPSSIIGVSVTEHTYQFKAAPDTNYVIIRYDISNTTSFNLSNVYAGLFTDWDMQPNFATNVTGYNPALHLGYAHDVSVPGTVWCGVRALDSTTASYYAIINDTDTFEKSDKWNYLSSGVVTTRDTTDISFVMSNGPFTIPRNARRRIAFAMIAGTDSSGLVTSANAAKAKWNLIESIDGVKPSTSNVPKSFALRQNYPNPFNPTTNISYDLPNASRVTLSIYNVLGQQVATIVNKNQTAGTYTASFNAGNYASGVYFYRLTAVSGGASVFTDVKKLVLVK
jgi:hypothetical protein